MLPVVLESLSKRYGRKDAVRALSLRVEPGELFGLLGPNGSGKSTTLRMLCTLTEPSSGSARIGDHGLAALQAVRREIAVVFQEPSLDPRLSARENLELYGALYRPLWARHERDRRCASALERMGLSDRGDDLVSKYSWGMRRRLEICRALMTDPSVLFLDEPTTGLDPQSRYALWEHLLALREERGLTVLVATHDMEEAERCDRLGVLSGGELAFLGSPAALCEQAGEENLTRAFLAVTGTGIGKEGAAGPTLKGKDAGQYRRS